MKYRQLNADIVLIESLYFMSDSKHVETTENTMICMARFLSSNGQILSYFDNICLQLSTHAYFEVCFHSMLSKYENSKNEY